MTYFFIIALILIVALNARIAILRDRIQKLRPHPKPEP